MKLTLADRRIALDYLPPKEDYTCLKEIRQARECLAWTADESIEANKHTQDTPNGKIYEPAYLESVVVDIPLTGWIMTKIQEELREKCKKRELMDRDFVLYEKFVVAYDQV
jgi:hypothetical protein